MTGGPSWLAALGDDDQAQFFLEMDTALDASEAADSTEPLETCLREWRATAEALADPRRHAILTTPGSSDYEEVPRP